MDNNKHVTELLSFYIDGICSPEEKKRVDKHLPGCSRCRQDLADLRQTINLVSELEEVEPPAGIWEGVEEKIARKSLWGIFGWKPVPAAVIAVAVLLIAVSINKYTTKITSTIDTKITPLLAPVTNAPVRALEKTSLAQGRLERKEAPEPALAGNTVSESADNFSLAPAKDSCGATAVSQMVPAAQSIGGSVSPYTIGMQVAEREKSFRQNDSRELFLQMQKERYRQFINDLSRAGRVSQPQPYLGTEPEPVEAGATTTPKMINIRFNSSR